MSSRPRLTKEVEKGHTPLEGNIFFQKRAAGELLLADGTRLAGRSFGAKKAAAGEVVFATGMVGYPESLTDPSYAGQILVLTYPLVGNYGVPGKSAWESRRIRAAGLIVSTYIDTPSHPTSRRTLGEWLTQEGIPALEIRDTRALVQKLRTHGVIAGEIVFGHELTSEIAATSEVVKYPDMSKIVAKMSTNKASLSSPHAILSSPRRRGSSKTENNLDSRLRGNDKGRVTTRYTLNPKPSPRILLIDCGAKENIERELLARGAKVIRAPWDYSPFPKGGEGDCRKGRVKFDAAVISNGPGDPKDAAATIATIQELMRREAPILGICLGHQLLALAAGGDTRKLKFGHRGQNHPCREIGSKRSYLTTQNHGYTVSKIPKGFRPWFVNGNDGTNEGLRHPRLPFLSVQFHPEAAPGPRDTTWIFDRFLALAVKKRKR